MGFPSNATRPFAGLNRMDLQGLRFRLVDAKDQVAGRLASYISVILQGKNKPTYDPAKDNGDVCIVYNAKDVVLTGRKWEKKVYRHHTGISTACILLLLHFSAHWYEDCFSLLAASCNCLWQTCMVGGCMRQCAERLVLPVLLCRCNLLLLMTAVVLAAGRISSDCSKPFCMTATSFPCVPCSGFPGGLREMTAQQVWLKDPTDILRKAVRGMLPKNDLRRDRMRKLRIFPTAEHPFQEFPTTGYQMPPRNVRDRRMGWAMPQGFVPMNPDAYLRRLKSSRLQVQRWSQC